MSFTRKDENEEIKSCNNQVAFFQQMALEKCRMIPHGVSLARGGYPGDTFRLLHSEDECRNASQDVINQLEKCNNFTFKPK